MSEEQLDEIAAEFAGDPAPEGEGEAPPAPAPDPDTAPVDPQALHLALALSVQAIGGVICGRLAVSPLSDPEVRAVAGALVVLADVYDFQTSPKAAAWFGLVGTVTPICLTRMAEIKAREGEGAEPAEGDPGAPEAAPSAMDELSDTPASKAATGANKTRNPAGQKKKK